jgi:hypothetical protein
MELVQYKVVDLRPLKHVQMFCDRLHGDKVDAPKFGFDRRAFKPANVRIREVAEAFLLG